LDFELAKSVGQYFRLNTLEMEAIAEDVINSVKTWKVEANIIGIPRSEINLMEAAFRV
jgi:serine/threonine-protein kinase HipA